MSETHSPINTFCTKQPVLDADQKIRGYAFCFPDPRQLSAAQYADDSKEALRSATESLQGAVGTDKNPIKIGVEFSPQTIIDGLPYAFSSEHTVIELQEPEQPSDTLLNSLQSLRKKNYTIAIHATAETPHSPQLIQLANLLKVDMLQMSENQRAEMQQLAQSTQSALLAKNVDNPAAFDMARQSGCTLFQGYFFQNTGSQTAPRSLSSMESTRLRLFRLLQSSEPDFGALGEVIKADASLSYRLLALLNSPSFKLLRKIESVGQALVLLGWQQLKSWLLVVILSDLMVPDKCPELVINSAQRGKFFELAAQKTRDPHEPETLFLLGLFSLLEPMMNVPMAVITEKLPLKKDIKDALCGQSNDCSPWLELAGAFEARNWDQVRALLKHLQLDSLDAANAYHASALWANTMLALL